MLRGGRGLSQYLSNKQVNRQRPRLCRWGWRPGLRRRRACRETRPLVASCPISPFSLLPSCRLPAGFLPGNTTPRHKSLTRITSDRGAALQNFAFYSLEGSLKPPWEVGRGRARPPTSPPNRKRGKQHSGSCGRHQDQKSGLLSPTLLPQEFSKSVGVFWSPKDIAFTTQEQRSP